MATINGTNGRDILIGTDQFDHIRGLGGDDFISGGEGDDYIEGEDGNDVLFGGTGGDRLLGGSGNDALFGGDAADFLNGGEGSDALYGGAGLDSLFGGEGRDFLKGGPDQDVFEFFTAAEPPIGIFSPDSTFASRDFVDDFEGAGIADGDSIDLDGQFPYVFVGRLDINPQVGAPLPGAGNGRTEVGYVQSGDRTYLIADSNDDGVLNGEDFAVEFRGRLDFIFADVNDHDSMFEPGFFVNEIAGTEGYAAAPAAMVTPEFVIA